jgi:prolyl-tRNA synthetase
MRYSHALIPTVKEVPAEAEIPSHQLMIRAGLMRKLASGTYTYLPLGWKILRKIMEIVRQEMNAAGAQEISMPILQPMELWQRTGRDKDYGPTMFKVRDRKDSEAALAPTAEEVVTSLVAGEVSSYKQLPLNIYQINTKFRDELRPRFGVLRSREFIMKDAYSFHADLASLEETYKKMYDAYCRIFARSGLKYAPVEAESGPIGGSASHEFMIPCSAGEDTIVHTADGSYAANIEKAEIDPPAANPADIESKRKTVPAMQEVHTPAVGSIEAVCNFLKTKPQDMIKTLIYAGTLAGPEVPSRHDVSPMEGPKFDMVIVCLVRGDHDVNENKVLHASGAAHIELAGEATITSLTGAAVGFAGPMGLAKKVSKLMIDPTVAAMVSGVTGANKTDYHVKNVVPGRDFPLAGENVIVTDIRNAAPGDSHGGKELIFSKGIEVGHVFKLGTKYSDKLGAKFLDEAGQEHPCIMGCYGIGINRIMASAIETSFDENGIIWPISIAPFEVIITPANQDDKLITDAAEKVYGELLAAGVDVLIDDRDVRGGVKFKDADLLGIPVRITIGKKSIAENCVEIKLRKETEIRKVPIAEVKKEVLAIISSLKNS